MQDRCRPRHGRRPKQRACKGYSRARAHLNRIATAHKVHGLGRLGAKCVVALTGPSWPDLPPLAALCKPIQEWEECVAATVAAAAQCRDNNGIWPGDGLGAGMRAAEGGRRPRCGGFMGGVRGRAQPRLLCGVWASMPVSFQARTQGSSKVELRCSAKGSEASLPQPPSQRAAVGAAGVAKAPWACACTQVRGSQWLLYAQVWKILHRLCSSLGAGRRPAGALAMRGRVGCDVAGGTKVEAHTICAGAANQARRRPPCAQRGAGRPAVNAIRQIRSNHICQIAPSDHSISGWQAWQAPIISA